MLDTYIQDQGDMKDLVKKHRVFQTDYKASLILVFCIIYVYFKYVDFKYIE